MSPSLACPRCHEPLTEDEAFYGPCYSCRFELRDGAHVPSPQAPEPEPERPAEAVEELAERVVAEVPLDGPPCVHCTKPVATHIGRPAHPCCETWAAQGVTRCPACAESERASKPRDKSTGPVAARKQNLPKCDTCGGAMQFGQPSAHFACHPDPTSALAAHGGKSPDPCKACGRTSHHPCPICRGPLEHPDIHPAGVPTDAEWRSLARMAHPKIAAGIELADVESEALRRFPGPPDVLCRNCLAYRPAGHRCGGELAPIESAAAAGPIVPPLPAPCPSRPPGPPSPRAPAPPNAPAPNAAPSKNLLQTPFSESPRSPR